MTNTPSTGGYQRPAGSPRLRPCLAAAVLLLLVTLALGLGLPAAAHADSDPSGASIGTADDVVGATANAPTKEDLATLSTTEPLAAKLADVVGHNRISINMVWTLVCGFRNNFV